MHWLIYFDCLSMAAAQYQQDSSKKFPSALAA
jgi:hypothetical protein